MPINRDFSMPGEKEDILRKAIDDAINLAFANGLQGREVARVIEQTLRNRYFTARVMHE